MSDALLTALVRTLDFCVIESSRSVPPFELGRAAPGEGPPVGHAVLRLLTPAPDWLSAVFADGPTETHTALGGAIPFVDHFLLQAEAAWHEGHEASASSGPFVATVGGADVLLRAVAVAQHERRLLILQRLTGEADLRPTLQRAREQTLEHERLVRQVGALHAPAAVIDRDLQTLLAAGLSPEHHALVERLSRASAEVQGALATLPSPPPRHRRQARTK